MIPVKVNISNVVDMHMLSSEQASMLANAVASGLANAYADNMRSVAKDKLHQTRKAFLEGIHVYEVSGNKYAVELIGFIPNAVTMGLSPFDMKDGFSKSKNRKSKKGGGWYLTIPFRHASPNAVASSTIFSGTMPAAVHNLAKKLKHKESLKKDQLPSPYGDRKFRSATGSFDKYTHKHPIYEGMVKNVVQNQTKYSTFRRVSDTSDSNSWIHTGIEAKNIHIEALQQMNIPSETKRIIDNFLDEI